MMSRKKSIQIINQLLDFLSGQTVPESDFPVAQLIVRANVRHSHKEVSLFATLLLSQIQQPGIERYLSFGPVDSFYPGGLLGQCVGHYSTF
jgi:hypothetical protein